MSEFNIDYKAIEKQLINIIEKYSFPTEQSKYDFNHLDRDIKKYIDDVNVKLCTISDEEKTKIINEIYIMCDNLEYQYFGFCN